MKTIKERSKMLAELMNWKLAIYGISLPTEMQELRIQGGQLNDTVLEPYVKDDHGQFKEILFRFPEVILRMNRGYDGVYCGWYNTPTQENILDEILRMNGREVG